MLFSSSASAGVSGNLYGTISSTFTPTGHHYTDAVNILSTSQTTKQSLQPQPLIKAEVFDQTEQVNFRKSQLLYQQIFQPQHYFGPNRFCSQFVEEWQLGSGRDEQLSNHIVLPYNKQMYSKATEDNDKKDETYRQSVSHNIPIRATSDSQQLLSPHVQNTKLLNNMFQRIMPQDAAERHVPSNWLSAGWL